MNKTLIKKYYQMGIYKEKHLDIFVKAGYITADGKREIME
ncbi:MAG: XkdX family protein, partial [Clostridia bacterium]